MITSCRHMDFDESLLMGMLMAVQGQGSKQFGSWQDVACLLVMTGKLSVAGTLAWYHCSPMSRHDVHRDTLH